MGEHFRVDVSSVVPMEVSDRQAIKSNRIDPWTSTLLHESEHRVPRLLHSFRKFTSPEKSNASNFLACTPEGDIVVIDDTNGTYLVNDEPTSLETKWAEHWSKKFGDNANVPRLIYLEDAVESSSFNHINHCVKSSLTDTHEAKPLDVNDEA